MELFGGFRFGFFGSSGLCICFGCLAFVLQSRDQAADRRLQQADDFADSSRDLMLARVPSCSSPT